MSPLNGVWCHCHGIPLHQVKLSRLPSTTQHDCASSMHLIECMQAAVRCHEKTIWIVGPSILRRSVRYHGQ